MRPLLRVLRHAPELERWSFVTPAQREVFLLIAKGYGTGEISQKLRQTPSSVQDKKTRAFEWLGLCCSADATCFALKHGLITATLGVEFSPPVSR